MTNTTIYQDIATRTGGDIYIGVVGPVRTGKSTFIKRFMETTVIPNIENVYSRERARDELPQSGSGRTVMTAEPKFVPEEAVEVTLEGGSTFSVRLIDCVGYMVPGAVGQTEDDRPRMVTTPWVDHEISMTEAAEIGTGKVISDHSTIGIVVTTDGTVTDIGREDYLEAERRVISELQALQKPFIVLVNSASPESAPARETAEDIAEEFGVTALPVNCLELQEQDVAEILKNVLYAFSVSEMDFFFPKWVEALEEDADIKRRVYAALLESTRGIRRIADVEGAVAALGQVEDVSAARVEGIDLGTGVVRARLELPREMFYETLSRRSGFDVADDGDLMTLLTELSRVKSEYDKVAGALEEVRATGYGIVMPSKEELTLEEPEIVKHSGRYGVRLRASAPSIHMLRADIQTEISPVVGSEQQSEELVGYLLSEFEEDTGKIWESNIFGKSLHELVSEGLNTKIKRMPDDARYKLKETLQRIINEGSGGLICIIL